jgi:hypothetical protein
MNPTRAVSNPNVHRQLDRHDTGPDARQLQLGINRRADSLKLPWLGVTVDGESGPRTEHSANLILFAMGAYGPPVKRIRTHHEISQYAQRLLRGTRHRNPVMVALALKRRGEVRKWRAAHDTPVQETSALGDLIALIAKGMAYAWGGGHVTPANSGPGDCSWLASKMRQWFEPGTPTGTTYTLAEEGLPGFGRVLTLMIKNIPGRADESHVIELWILENDLVDKYELHRWVLPVSEVPVDPPAGSSVLVSECGGSDNPTSGNGPSWVIPGEGMGLTVQQRLAEFSIHRHPEGF